MTHKRIDFVNLERTIAVESIFLEPNSPMGSGILKVPPYQAAFAAIRWAWLQWQAAPEFASISDKLVLAVQRTSNADARGEADERRMRGEFDWFVLSCAILSGDQDRVRSEATHARNANQANSGIFQAIAGMIKARIDGDTKHEREQLEIAENCEPSGPLPSPSRSLLRAFVNRDYGAMEKEIVKGVKKHWSDRYMGKKSMRVLVKDDPDHIILDIAKKDPHVTWAYVEAVFAKLAMQDGTNISYDDLWFPLRLVNARRESAAR